METKDYKVFSWKTFGNKKDYKVQTVEKDWKLFHLQTKQWKKIGNFFTYKNNNGKRLETFSLTNQTVKKDWKLFHLQTKQWKKIENFFN